MYKKVYWLSADMSVADHLPKHLYDGLYDIDEIYTTKKEWKEQAKKYTDEANKHLEENEQITVEQLFGKCEWRGLCICLECEETFWIDDKHECM